MLEMIKHYIGNGSPTAYIALFLIVFAETGLVIAPFLPGDSLLFAAGALVAAGILQPVPVVLIFLIAAFLGDNVNYWIGRTVGQRAVEGKIRFIKREHLEKTQAFFARQGTKTIILARFTPIVRTFAPFVAGIGAMRYVTFLTYSVIGALLWVGICVGAGIKFGENAWVKSHFEVVVVAVVLISLIPIVLEYLLSKRHNKPSM